MNFDRHRDNGKLLFPAVDDEVQVDICPCPHSGETWTQFGKALATWSDRSSGEGDVWAAIEITRPMTPDENPDEWNTSDEWNGCAFVAYLKRYDDEWRAVYPLSDRFQKMWGCGD